MIGTGLVRDLGPQRDKSLLDLFPGLGHKGATYTSWNILAPRPKFPSPESVLQIQALDPKVSEAFSSLTSRCCGLLTEPSKQLCDSDMCMLASGKQHRTKEEERKAWKHREREGSRTVSSEEAR